MLSQNRFGRFNFGKALLLGGVCTAILTGCNQSAQDDGSTDAAATGEVRTASLNIAATTDFYVCITAESGMVETKGLPTANTLHGLPCP